MNIQKSTQQRVRENLRVKINQADNEAEYAESVRQSNLEFLEWLYQRKLEAK